MTKAVFSLWKKPIDNGQLRYGYNSLYDLACSYVLAIETARKHYPNIDLVTDDAGKNLLQRKLGIQFNNVSTELNEIANLSPLHWAMPKIIAMKVQRESFLYLEGNVMLWDDLPKDVKNADVAFQNPEPTDLFDAYYLELIKDTFSSAPVIPEAIKGFELSAAFNTSISLINNLEFSRIWTDAAIEYVMSSRNTTYWERELGKGRHQNMLFDYWFPACIAGRAGLLASNNVGMYLRAYDAEKYIYSHTHGTSRREEKVTAAIRKRIEENYPQYLDALNDLRKTTSTESIFPAAEESRSTK
jgi:hypothetical protein